MLYETVYRPSKVLQELWYCSSDTDVENDAGGGRVSYLSCEDFQEGPNCGEEMISGGDLGRRPIRDRIDAQSK